MSRTDKPLAQRANTLSSNAYVDSNPLTATDPFGLRPLNERERRCLSSYIPQVD